MIKITAKLKNVYQSEYQFYYIYMALRNNAPAPAIC